MSDDGLDDLLGQLKSTNKTTKQICNQKKEELSIPPQEQERLEAEATERAELEYNLKHNTTFGIKTIRSWISRKEESLAKGFHYSGVNHYHVYRYDYGFIDHYY